MRALAVVPGKPSSLHLREISAEQLGKGDLLCELVQLGVCGTDREISAGKYGTAPAGQDFLVIGHESLGRVIEAAPDSGFAAGDWVVGFVRRPDPEPCVNCAEGEWDMCRNGKYTERGIKGVHGYGSERYRLESEYAILIPPALSGVGVLLEPTSVVAKAWEHIERIALRSVVKPKRALITGGGPVGLLAAMIGVQKGLEVHVLDRNVAGPKKELALLLGAHYHSDFKKVSDLAVDVTVECTGSVELIVKLLGSIKPNSILCLAGVSSGGRVFPTDIGALNRDLVLENEVIFGTVNANRRHYEKALAHLKAAELNWLSKLITRKIPFDRFAEALAKSEDDIKTVLVPR